MSRYPQDSVDNHPDGYAEDDGTMPDSVAELSAAVVGHRIVRAERQSIACRDFAATNSDYWPVYRDAEAFVLTLDDGRRVALIGEQDCCAHTEIEGFLLHPERVDHAITAVETEGGYTKWHILADLGDVLTLDVDWSCGNPFYYAYGFTIAVSTVIEGEIAQPELPGAAS